MSRVSAFGSVENASPGRRCTLIRYCTKCLTPSTRPRVQFDESGVCNACLNSLKKRSIDWNSQRDEFLSYVERFRPEEGPYDCIVPWSGGKDSSTIAYRLKFEFGLNPLLVTASPLILNKIGAHNREEMLRLGFDHVFVRPNQRVARHLARRFFVERGNPKVHWEASKEAVPIRVALNYRVPLVFCAEHGESEYGGLVLDEESSRLRDFTEIVEHVVGDDARNWEDDVVKAEDLAPYVYPDPERVHEAGIHSLYFAYFFRWSMYDNFQFIREKIDFSTAPHGRTVPSRTSTASTTRSTRSTITFSTSSSDSAVQFGMPRG